MAGCRCGDLELHHLDPVASLALLDGGDHARVVEDRCKDLVARFELHAEDEYFEGLAGVACDGNFFGIAFEDTSESGANRFDLRFEDPPHVVAWGLVAKLDLAPQGILDDAGRWRATAIVEVDGVAVEGECLLNLHPEIFVLGVIHAAVFRHCVGDEVEGVVSECGDGEGASQKFSSGKRHSRQYMSFGRDLELN